MGKPDPEMKSIKHVNIHNVRFYNLVPRSIQCLAYNKLLHKLALSRDDGSIEIWDIQHSPCLEKTIHKSPGNSVEGIVWSGERLFSVGLSGELVEWQLRTLQPRRKQYATGNAIWCVTVTVSGNELALGTEEGYINIFDISDDQFQYKRMFDKQEGRVLCCRFDATGDFLVTGSIETIRIWDVHSGHAVHKLTVPRTERRKEVIVWSLAVLRDFTIISGDSRGCVTVWNGRTASHLETHQALQADVLSVAVNEEENLLMCSGIEPIIRIYAKTQIKREDMVFYRWVKYLQRRVHDHDVKALVATGDHILSAGMDGYIGISSMTKTTSNIAKYGPFLQKPCATVSPKNKLLMLRFTNYIELWRLGSSIGNKSMHQFQNPHQRLQLSSTPEKLLSFKSKQAERIVCATLSPDGCWLCYSTLHDLRIFRLLVPDNGTALTHFMRVRDPPKQFMAIVATHLEFSADSKRLFVASAQATRQIFVFSLVLSGGDSVKSSGGEVDFIECIDTDKHVKDTITILTVSPCIRYLIIAGADCTIAVWRFNVESKHFRHHLNLPRYSATTTALAVHSRSPRLVAAFSDGKIFEYDLEEMCFTCAESRHFLASTETHCVQGIALDERNPNIFILQNDSTLFVLEKCASNSRPKEGEVTVNRDAAMNSSKDTTNCIEKPVTKKAKTNNAIKNEVLGLSLKMQKSFEHFISLCWLSTNELVAVGVNPVALIVQLPDVFKQKKFGVA